jgi:NAD-dependent DNA ligase
MRKQLRLSIGQFIEAQQNIPDTDNKFVGQNILFSGFRNKEWEKIITDNGGKVASSISSKTTILVTTQEDLDKGTNAKIQKARSLNVRIMTNNQFEQEYIL